MEDISRFIGIKHYFGESSFEKCDCLGLCRLFYREHGWKGALYDGKPDPDKDNFSSFGAWRRLYTWCLKNMDRVDYDDLQFGDFIIFRVANCLHTGLYVNYGKLLSMQIPTEYGVSESTLYHRKWWKQFYLYSFRRRK